MQVLKLFLKTQIALAFLALFLIGNARAEENSPFAYRMRVRVEPGTHKLEVEAWVQHPPSSQFNLNKDFTVREITADGTGVPFRRDASTASLVLVDAQSPRELHVRYDGEISGVIWDVNLIGPELVELALYSGWYPRFKGASDFTFEIEANVPQGFLTVTNGRRTMQRERDGRLITRWASYRPGFDMVLLASPRLHQLARRDRGIQVEMYYFQLPERLVQSKIDGLTAAMGRLSSFYGPPNVKGVLRFAYSPRSGWGYSRIPLFLVSEQYALKKLGEQDGEALDLLGNCHELAHFWWNIVDMSTPNDWINEGLAEYSAFRVSEDRFGKAFVERRIAEYRQHAAQNKTSSAIVETENDSPDRYVNRYEKTTLMFLEAQRRFGQDSLHNFLKAFYTRFTGTHQATTAAFLEDAKKNMGAEAEAFFHEELYRKPSVSSGDRAAAAN
jgi:hypothetical protein